MLPPPRRQHPDAHDANLPAPSCIAQQAGYPCVSVSPVPHGQLRRRHLWTQQAHDSDRLIGRRRSSSSSPCSCRGTASTRPVRQVEYNNNGWDYFLSGWLPLILIAVLAAHVAITRFSPDTKIPDLPVPWSQGYLIAGIVAAVIVVLRLIIGSDDVSGSTPASTSTASSASSSAVIAAICVAAGGFMKSKEGDVLPPATGALSGTNLSPTSHLTPASPLSSRGPRGTAPRCRTRRTDPS